MLSRLQIAASCVALTALLSTVGVVRGVVMNRRSSADRVERNLKDVLTPKIEAEWTAFKNKDAKAYGDLLSDDFIAVEVDGEGTRNRSQAMREIERGSVDDFTLSRVDARPLGEEAAMVTYEAFVQFPPAAQVRFLRVYVSEVWRKQGEDWRALHYQETRVR
jgi:hypothetical protein